MAANDQHNQSIQRSEHVEPLTTGDNVSAKRVVSYGWDGSKGESGEWVRQPVGVPSHDYIAVTYPTSSTEVYTFKQGGVSGTTVATMTVTYTDGTKENISSIART